MVKLDRMVRVSKIVHFMRTISSASDLEQPAAPYEPIIADFRATMTMLKCAASERLLRAGVSMAQLHILFTLERNGEMPMSRLADVLDVSLSSATGLIDRIEDRGFVERIRVPEDRRVVVIRVTPAGRQMLQEVDALSDDLLRAVLERLDPAQLPGVAAAVAALRSSLASTLDAPEDRHAPSTTAPRSATTLRTV